MNPNEPTPPTTPTPTPPPQPPQPPQPPTQPPQPPTSTPLTPPAQNPYPGYEQPLAPPVAPTQPPTVPPPNPTQPTAMPGQPMGSASGTPEMSSPKKPFPVKLVVLIGSIVGGLAILGVVAWLLISLVFANNITLEEYSNSEFSLLVPDSYTVKGSGTLVSFEEPDVEDKATQSAVLVTKLATIPEGSHDKFIEQLDSTLNDTYIAESFSNVEDHTISNVAIEKGTQGGYETRVITSDLNVTDSGKTVGKLRFIYIFSETEVYTVIVVAHDSDPGLTNNMAKITDSFKLNS